MVNLAGLRVVFYIRHSSHRQKKEYQEKILNDMTEKYGLNYIRTYYDPGKSAYRLHYTKRPDLMKMLSAAESKEFDAVLAYAWDRLGRNSFEGLEVLKMLMDTGVLVVIYNNGHLEVLNSNDILNLMVKLGVADWEASTIGKRTLDGRYFKAEECIWPGGNNGYGYIIQNKQVVIRPETKPIIRIIFQSYIMGDSFEKIAQSLPKGSYNGKNWTKYGVEGIIKNPIYAGFMSWGKRKKNSGSQYKDRNEWKVFREAPDIEPVVSIETFERANELLNKKAKGEFKPRELSSEYLLSSLLECQCCLKMKTKDQRSKHVSIKTGEVKVYGNKIYYCPNCGTKVIAEDLDEFVWSKFRCKYAFRPKTEVYQLIASSINNEISIIKKDISSIEENIDQWDDKIKRINTEIANAVKRDEAEQNKDFILALDSERNLYSKKFDELKALNAIKKEELRKLESLMLKPEYWAFEIDRINNKPNSTLEKSFLVRQFIAKVVYDNTNISIYYKWELGKEDMDTRQASFTF